MFKRTKETIDNLRKENKRLRHNNELLIRKDVELLRAISDFRELAKEQQYNSTVNMQNKIKKTLACLDRKLESFEK